MKYHLETSKQKTLSNNDNKKLKSTQFYKIIDSWALMIKLVILVNLFTGIQSKVVDNTCTFSIDGKLFSFLQLNKGTKLEAQYKQLINNKPQQYIKFNFCETFIPAQCLNDSLPYAYSYHIKKNQDQNQYKCIPYSSDSKTSNFNTSYQNDDGQIKVNLFLYSEPYQNNLVRATYFTLECEQAEDSVLQDIDVDLTFSALTIKAKSPHGCPVFQLSSIWTAISDNSWIFGTILVFIGFIMLFFGVLMIHVVIFISTYFLSFAVLVSLFTAFMGPQSSRVGIYFALLLILFLSTLLAYGLTKLVNVSIFFIGAFFGFIVGAMMNTIFIQITGIVSYWSLVIWQLLFIIPFGLLTFKYSQEIIVLSSSLTGSYMIVRPFSWMFGGFPNEFTLYNMIQNGQIDHVPWTFFLYMIIIILIAVFGALYQLLKLKRKQPGQHVYKSFMTENVQQHIDKIHQAVKHLINKYSNSQPNEVGGQDQNYKNLIELQQRDNHQLKKDQDKIESPNKTKQRKSRQQFF